MDTLFILVWGTSCKHQSLYLVNRPPWPSCEVLVQKVSRPPLQFQFNSSICTSFSQEQVNNDIHTIESTYSFTIDLSYGHLIWMFELYFLTNYELPTRVLNTMKFSDFLTLSSHETGEETGTQTTASPSTKATQLVERSWPDVLIGLILFTTLVFLHGKNF